MILHVLIASSVAAATPAASPAPTPSLAEAAHAIAVGRLDQARLMIGQAVAAGVKGPQVDRLLADLAFESGDNGEALARYDSLLKVAPGDWTIAERAGIAALKLGDSARAAPLIDRATASRHASWRAWNAKGVIADDRRDWATADAAYDQALNLAPDGAEVINNQGWSLVLRGEWRRAAGYFEHAASLDPKSERIANNLELARAALAGDLPQRRPGESDRGWAERLNDAGVAAQLVGDHQRAVAAFTQALRTSGSWYARAANNLQAAGGR